jgi:uncharacterized membrane protein (DUF485 family)
VADSMSHNNEQIDAGQKDLATKNKRLGIILGLIAIGFYVGFILVYWK